MSANYRFTIRFGATTNAIIDNKTGEVVGIPPHGGFFTCKGPSFFSKQLKETTMNLISASNKVAEDRRDAIAAMASKVTKLRNSIVAPVV